MKCAACGHANPEDALECARCGKPVELEDDAGETGVRPGSSDRFDDSSETGFRPPPSGNVDDASETGVRPAPTGNPDDSGVTGVRPTPPPGLSRPGTYAGSGATGAIPTYDSFGNRYEILELLGEGGMGRVYKAWDRELEKVIALKTIRGEQSSNPDVLKRFKQELLLARKITHKNVIRIHDMGEAGGVRFFTMEYIPGDSLKERIEKRGKIPAEQAVPMAKQILGALGEAHEQGVVHRDLKPQNIMIDQDGILHIMDFGIARSAQDTGMTVTGTVMGTPDYMSPEQVKGEKADAQADLFSFGVILYEMLTGTLPYQADTTAAKVMMRLSKKPRPPREIDEQIPKYLESIVLKCLEVDRELRYRTAREVLEDIEREQVDRSPIARLKRTLVLRKGTVAAAAVLAAAIGTAVYFAARAGAPPELIVAPTVLAVVPFNNASGDPSLDWLGPNLAEILVTELGQSSRVQTVSSDRVRQILNDLRIPIGAKLEPATVTRLAEFSSAEMIVSGQFLKLGQQIRIDAMLQDLKERRTVPLKAEAASENELIGAIAVLAKSVQENLGLSRDILAELQAQTFRPSSQSIQALRFYSEGLQLSRQGNELEALKRFENATGEDPEFALAYAALGQTYASLGYDYESEGFLRTAVELSSGLTQQERYMISAIQASVHNDFDKAIESYENLAEVMPEDAEVQFRLAELYERKGEYDRAKELYSSVLERDPSYLSALLALGNVEIKRETPQDSFEPLNRALSLAMQRENEEAKGNVSFSLGLAYRDLGRRAEASQYFGEALEIQNRIGDKRGMAESLKELGKLDWTAGSVEEAQARYEQALELQREIGDRLGAARVLLTLGEIHDRRGDVEKALALYKESLQTVRELGDKQLEEICLSYIGTLYLDRGEYGDAQTYLELELRMREDLGNKDLSETLHNLGEIALRTGRYNVALDHYLRALELTREAGDDLGIAIESHSLGTVFGYQGRLGASLKAKEDAIASLEKAGEGGLWRASILSGYGDALNRFGKFEEAKKRLDDALALARELEIPMLVAQTLNFIGEGQFYQGTAEASRNPFEESLQVALGQKDPRLVLPAQVNLAKLELWAARDSSVPASALETIAELARESDTLGLKYYSAECSISLAEALLRHGRYDEARDTLDALLRETARTGLRIHAAKARFLLGKAFRLAGNEAESHRQYREAGRILDEVRTDAGTDEFLKRADLAPIHEESLELGPAQTASQ
ncbi:MAG TPA: tetratricopeptide repeat protein [Vicinamibacteria bacterium]|jgi:tetratricopeptide (TPR) repeat protein